MNALAPPVEAVSSPVPPVAARLAWAGLLPFVVGAVFAWAVRDDARDYVLLGLSAYAGLVVAFLAGIHWGLAMRHGAALSAADWGLPIAGWCLAWVAVVMPPNAGLVVAGVLLVASYAVDRKRYPPLGAAAWLTLRFRLSALAALCCFLAAANA